MLSIRKTVNELDRLEEFYRSAISCYAQAIGSTEEYAIEFDAELVARFRAQLQALRLQVRDTASPELLKKVQASFDASLKGFQGSVTDHLKQLRREVAAAASAVDSFTSSLTQSGSDLEAGVKRELQQLEKAAASDDINVIRGGIRAASAKIATDVEQMRAGNQLAITQLKDEIRLLHQEIQGMRRSQQPPSEEQSPARQHLNGRMDELVRRGRPFSVLLAVIRNLEGLQNCFAAKIIESGLNTFKARFESTLPGSATVGCWSKDQFAAVLDIEPALAITLSSDVLRKVSSPIVEIADGVRHSLAFEVATGVIDFQPGSDPAKFQNKLSQLVTALAGKTR